MSNSKDCRYCRTTAEGDDEPCLSLWKAHNCPWMGQSDWAALEIEATAKTNLVEECAKIAEGHVGAGGYPAGNDIEDSCRRIGYDDACRDIAKAIRDAYGAKA